MNRYEPVIATILILAAVVVSSCTKDQTTAVPPAQTTSTYVGTIASGTESGLLSMTFPPGGGALNGEIIRVQPTAATIVLSGTFASNILAATGGNYSLTGVLAGGNTSGAYNGPNGVGVFTAQPSTNNSVRVFAGAYTTSVAGHLNGTFNLVVNAAVITGWAISSDNQSQTGLAGTLQDSTIALHAVNAPGTGFATGTLHGSSSVTGTYNAGTDSGSWSGQRVQ